MGASTCFIASKLKVGFQERNDTFTGKLAYVIYYDAKNKLRKEASWNGWCNKSLGDIEVDNVPTSGFMINKGIQRSSEWFGTGRTVVRIHDPRGFEFEITHDNLIQLLMHSDVSKRDIVQECVYAWFGTQLVLLPTNSAEYQSSLVHTAKQSMKIGAKELIKGATYAVKQGDAVYMYLGHHEWFDWERVRTNGKWSENVRKRKPKKHIFVDMSSGRMAPMSPSTLSSVVDENVQDTYSTKLDEFLTGPHASHLSDVKFTTEVIDTLPTQYINRNGYHGSRELTFIKVIDDKNVLRIRLNGNTYVLDPLHKGSNKMIDIDQCVPTDVLDTLYVHMLKTDSDSSDVFSDYDNIRNDYYRYGYSHHNRKMDTPYTGQHASLIEPVRKRIYEEIIKPYVEANPSVTTSHNWGSTYHNFTVPIADVSRILFEEGFNTTVTIVHDNGYKQPLFGV